MILVDTCGCPYYLARTRLHWLFRGFKLLKEGKVVISCVHLGLIEEESLQQLNSVSTVLDLGFIESSQHHIHPSKMVL
jgi:archaellum biogenesis ATPase FlaH